MIRTLLGPTGLLAAFVLAGSAACVALPDELAEERGGTARADTPGTTTPTRAPVARLTNTQYENTVRDLFAPIALPDLPFPKEPLEAFDTRRSAQPLGADHIEAFLDNAARIAERIVPEVPTLTGCRPATPADEEACAASFIERFGRRAYRRPLTPEDQASLIALYRDARKSEDFARAIGTLVEGILQSPHFLYRIERTGQGAGTVDLGPYELASRLSYFLWNTMPDDQLLQAATTGQLLRSSELLAQTRRMLGDARGRAMVARFHSAWLRLDRLHTIGNKDASLNMTMDAALALREGTLAYVDELFFKEGTLTAFLQDSTAMVNASSAPFYGVSAPGPNLVRVSVDPTQRAGILTSAGLLAALAHERESAPILRGIFVLDRLLCRPPPPPDVANVTPPRLDPRNPTTTRERIEKQHSVGGCQGCHQAIDGIGFGFENYDALGKWRTTDNGFPVDASGALNGSKFVGAVELSKKLATDTAVHTCVTAQWMKYSLGLESSELGDENLKVMTQEFSQSGLRFQALIETITLSDMFRRRVAD